METEERKEKQVNESERIPTTYVMQEWSLLLAKWYLLTTILFTKDDSIAIVLETPNGPREGYLRRQYQRQRRNKIQRGTCDEGAGRIRSRKGSFTTEMRR
jgi:hypothetical protein